jgi:tetratricopeptide (TPR) repeat protein
MQNFQSYTVLLLVVFSTLSSTAEETTIQKEADSLYASFAHYNNKHNYDSSMHYGDEFVKHRVKYGTTSQVILAYGHKIKSLKRFGKMDEAFRMSLTIYDKFCSSSNDITQCKSCYSIYNQLAEFMITMRDYRQGINYINGGCNPEINERNFYIKAKLYSLMEMPDSTVIQTLESIKIARTQNNPTKLVATYNQHGLITKVLEQYDEAIIAFSTAIKLLDSLGLNEKRYGYILGNLGACYYEKGDFDRAYKSLQMDSDKSKKNDRGSYLSAEIMLAEIDIKRKNYKQALLRLDGLPKTLTSPNDLNNLLKSPNLN